jgi:hypothetical protein
MVFIPLHFFMVWKLDRCLIDVVTAFLHSKVDEEIY